MLLQQAEHLDILPRAVAVPFGSSRRRNSRKTLRQRPARQRPGMIQCSRLGLQQRQIMQRFKADLLVLPDPCMLRHVLTIGTQNDAVAITFGHDRMVRPAHRHRIIVPVKAHQRQRTGRRRKLAAGLKGGGRQRQEGFLIPPPATAPWCPADHATSGFDRPGSVDADDALSSVSRRPAAPARSSSTA